MIDEKFRVLDGHLRGRRLAAIQATSRVDSGYPSGYYYRFQYYDTDAEEAILRYDNANDAHGVGPHHRHLFDEVTGVTFRGLESHVLRFTIEVLEIHARI